MNNSRNKFDVIIHLICFQNLIDQEKALNNGSDRYPLMGVNNARVRNAFGMKP